MTNASPPRRPAARASAARDNLSLVDVYRPGAMAQVRSLIPPESLEAIDKTAGVSWLEFEHDHWLMDCTLEVLGREDAVECWRQAVAQLIERPLLRNFVEGTLRLFGTRPGKVIRMIPKGWSLAYRDFCNPAFVSLGENAAEIRFEDVAPQAFQSEGYLHCWHAVCLGIFDLEKPPNGRAEFEFDAARSLAVVSFGWG
jgi:hypothetical protein